MAGAGDRVDTKKATGNGSFDNTHTDIVKLVYLFANGG
jgi:hypothetical protein